MGVARARADLADVDALLLSGDHAAARRAALALLEASPPGDASRGPALAALARALAFDGELADGEALRLARDGAQQCAAAHGEVHPETARARASLGLVQLRAGDPAAARATLLGTLDTPALDGLPQVRGLALLWLAEAEVQLQLFDEARTHVGAGLAGLASAEPPGRAILEAALRDVEALALLYQGEVSAGRAAAASALELAGNHPESVTAHLLLSDGANLAGDLPECAEQAHLALSLADATLRPGHPLRARALSRAASAESRSGDFEAAFEHHRRAWEISVQSLGPEHPQTTDHLVDAGVTLYEAGDLAAATERFEAALAPTERQRGSDSLAVATIAYNLSNVYGDAGRWPEAEAAIRRALAVWQTTHGPGHPHQALGLTQLAWILDRPGHELRALEAYGAALEARIAASGPRHPAVAEIRGSLAAILARVGRLDEAEAQVRQAVALLAPLEGWRDPVRARTLALQARLSERRGRRQDAAHLAMASAEALAGHLVRNVRFLGERQALAYATQDFEGRDLLVSLAARRGSGKQVRRWAFEALVGARHLVLDALVSRAKDARTAADPRLRAAWTRYAGVRGRLATLILRGIDEDEAGRVQLRALEREAREIERDLAVTGAGLQGRAAVGLTLDELRATLPSGTVLVSFAVYRPRGLGAGLLEARYAGFVVRRDRPDPVVVPLGPAARIDRLVERWHQDLRRYLEAGAEGADLAAGSGEALRRAAWDPLARHLAGASRVLLVPDGALQLVNFAALPAGHRYLVETGPTLHLLSAERDLRDLPEEPRRGDSVLVVAAPDFDARDGLGPAMAAGLTRRERRWPCRSPAQERWRPLPGAGLEAADIESLWRRRGSGEARVLVGAGATERSLKELAAGYDVVHLATHAFRAAGSCGAEPARQGGGLPRDSPLLEVGLPLAGANQRGRTDADEEDGILTAEEVATLDLGRSRWVVLSACDTGEGQIVEREGVLGLRRAFALAGARTLILSLWPVDDSHARNFMRELYEARFARGLDTAESIRAASLAILEQVRQERGTACPALWAPFVAAGDWR